VVCLLFLTAIEEIFVGLIHGRLVSIAASGQCAQLRARCRPVALIRARPNIKPGEGGRVS
jgi:hypothetical protein